MKGIRKMHVTISATTVPHFIYEINVFSCCCCCCIFFERDMCTVPIQILVDAFGYLALLLG